MPANMKTVEEQKEDVPFDMIPHTDSEGHIYDFGFGMNWKGAIVDKRIERYKK
jgi:beta-glucosidase